jgi:hypothetical protein
MNCVEGARLCGCGCGERLVAPKSKHRPGHQFRGVTKSESHRQKIRESLSRRGEAIRASARTCPRCGLHKSAAEFGKQGKRRSSYCLPCRRMDRREWDAKNPEITKRRNRLRSFYVTHGIREPEYLKLLEKQNGCCAICGTDDPSPKDRLVIDHCHKTLEIRGLLCCRCNSGIGYFFDDPERLINAAHYVRTARTGVMSLTRRGAKRKLCEQ